MLEDLVSTELVRPPPEEQASASVTDAINPFEGMENPFGANGILTHLGEHLPLVNQGIQEVHRNRGDTESFERAKSRNPVGADGVMTQVGEHIPLVADGIEAMHRMNCNENAAERARARTLPRLLSKDGAVTKVAELIPGTNIVAAMMHEMNGNHDEAVRALSIFDNWTQVGEPDGPLAKVAELFPGLDVVAFASHVSKKQYAQALRSITKTKWASIAVASVDLTITGATAGELGVPNSSIKGVEVEPKGLSLIVGMNDVFTKFLEFDEHGRVRPKKFQREVTPKNQQRHRGDQKLEIVGVETEELLANRVSDITQNIVRSIEEGIPNYVKWGIDAANEWMIPRWRRETWRYWLLLKSDGVPILGPEFNKAMQKAFSRGQIVHKPIAPADLRVRLPPLPKTNPRRNRQDAVLCASTLGVAGCCGAKVATLACLGGVFAAAVSLRQWLQRLLYNASNQSNEECWEGAARQMDVENRQSAPQPETHAGMLEVRDEDANEVVLMVRDHVLDNIRGGSFLGPIIRGLMPSIISVFRGWGPEWEVVPFVIDIDTGPITLKTATWPEGLYLPSLRLAALCDLNIWGTGLSGIRIVLADSLINEYGQATARQTQDLDWRKVDERLEGFTQPLKITFDLDMTWPVTNQCVLELRNLRSMLHLPE